MKSFITDSNKIIFVYGLENEKPNSRMIFLGGEFRM